MASQPPFFVDGHLDLGTMALLYGRDLRRSVAALREDEGPRDTSTATVSLPALRQGRVGLVFATLWCWPASANLGFATGLAGSERAAMAPYRTPEEAQAQALAQLDVYRRWADEGLVRIIESRAALAAHRTAWPEDGVPGLVILMEGADPIGRPEDLLSWVARGVRIVGPAWGRTRYSGGTGAPGGLTDIGVALVDAMAAAGVILDVSHLSDQAFEDAMARHPTRVIASHSAARALRPGDRQLSDEMIRAVGAAAGVVGLPLYNLFLDARWTPRQRTTVSIADQWRSQVEHIAQLIGWDRVAVGSDLDGGFGRDESPLEIDTIADFDRLGAPFTSEQRAGLLGGNWLAYLEEHLP